MSVFGQFDNGPIQFNGSAIEPRGTIDTPSPSATAGTPPPAPSPSGGGVLPDAPQSYSRRSAPDTPAPSPSASPEPASYSGGDGGGDDGLSGGNMGNDPVASGMSSRPFRDPVQSAFSGRPFHMASIYSDNPAIAAPTHFAHVFEDGGDVDGPEGVEQGADSATLDPSAMFKSVLAHGRQRMGLPASLEGPQQSFDDGGEVDGGVLPDDGAQGDPTGGVTAGGNNMPDPRSTLRYLTGDGAVSPEVANALEQHIDPQGQMPQSQKTMAAIQSAPTPDAKFGMMQHYRTQFNGFAGGAHAALDKGDLAQAAMNATKAFSHVPTGKDIQFAPAGAGKIAVTARDGMRQFIGAGLLGKAPVRAGDDAWNKYHGSGGTMSMDAGGDVSEDAGDDADEQGVLPAQEQRADTTDSILQEHAAQDDQYEQPMVLDANQFKKLVTSGYDAPVEKGWGNFVNDVLGAIGPAPAEAAPYSAAKGGTLSQAAGQQEAPDTTVTRPTAPAAKAPAAAKGPDFGESDAKYQHALDRAEKLANRLFPWASQQDQRSNYVGKLMDEFGQNEGKIDLARSGGKLQMEQLKEQGRNTRAEGSQKNKMDITTQRQVWNAMNEDKRNIVRLTGQFLAANPNVANDPEKLNQMVHQQAARAGIDPDLFHGMIMNQISGQQGAPAGGGTKSPAGANMSAAKPGDTKPYTKNGVTKNYKFGTDGMWHLSP